MMRIFVLVCIFIVFGGIMVCADDAEIKKITQEKEQMEAFASWREVNDVDVLAKTDQNFFSDLEIKLEDNLDALFEEHYVDEDIQVPKTGPEFVKEEVEPEVEKKRALMPEKTEEIELITDSQL